MSRYSHKYLVTFVARDFTIIHMVCTRKYWSTWKFAFKKILKGKAWFFIIKKK